MKAIFLSLCLFAIQRAKADVSFELTSDGSQEENDAIPFLHFVAHNSTMTCTADEHSTPFNQGIRGTNLGGWMVLEPWITPSLFYQFLGGNENTTAMDMYSFCEVLGAEEANRQLRIHWDAWVTEEIIAELHASGAVNSLRLPVGDFMYVPYGPYVGCVDGALEKVDQLLQWTEKYNITVLIDVHTMKGSQNGFDNSGKSLGFQWTSNLNSEFSGLTTFEHWPIRSAEWVGKFDAETATYSEIYHDNIAHGLKVVEEISKRYSGHPSVLGIEPVNEPWQYTPLDILKRFYWDGYLITKKHNPNWLFVMHDSFRFDPSPEVWGGFMDGCPERVLDTHIYQAWRDPDSRIGFYTDACSQKSRIAAMERSFGPVVVGEWSLATDNCAMWLNGFNDNLPGFPRLPCKYTPCAETYMPGQPGTPVDPSKPIMGPYGTGMSGPVFGQCPGSRDWLKESNGNPLTGKDWIRAPPQAPSRLDDTDNVMKHLALKKIDAFSGMGHGFYFWNFRTDLYEPQWSYMDALERGWIPRDKDFASSDGVVNACQREDKGDFKCVLKHGQVDRAIKGGVAYVLNLEGLSDSDEAQKVLSLSGKELEDAAQALLGDFFDKYRTRGATCDFGGIALLIEEDRELTDDDSFGLSDDEYAGFVAGGPALWVVGLGALVVGLLGAIVGFIIAMRVNPTFNNKVRESRMFLPVTSSKNSLVRSSLALPDLLYDDVEDLGEDEIRKILHK